MILGYGDIKKIAWQCGGKELHFETWLFHNQLWPTTTGRASQVSNQPLDSYKTALTSQACSMISSNGPSEICPDKAANTSQNDYLYLTEKMLSQYRPKTTTSWG